jgi:hypothetical protein
MSCSSNTGDHEPDQQRESLQREKSAQGSNDQNETEASSSRAALLRNLQSNSEESVVMNASMSASLWRRLPKL